MFRRGAWCINCHHGLAQRPSQSPVGYHRQLQHERAAKGGWKTCAWWSGRKQLWQLELGDKVCSLLQSARWTKPVLGFRKRAVKEEDGQRPLKDFVLHPLGRVSSSPPEARLQPLISLLSPLVLTNDGDNDVQKEFFFISHFQILSFLLTGHSS